MTRAQLQGERDAWYSSGLRNGRIRATEALNDDVSAVFDEFRSWYGGAR